MAVATTAAVLNEVIGGKCRRLQLGNGEIERFEVQYAPIGIFELWDQLFGRGLAPQVRHVRDLIALGLIGGGMSDSAADALVASLPPSENRDLRVMAQALLGITFVPAIREADDKKKEDGLGEAETTSLPTTTPEGE